MIGEDHSGPAGPRPPLALIFGLTVTGILNNTLIGPALPDILDDLDQPESRAGYLVAAGAFAGIVMAPLIGLLADRYGRRQVLIPCLIDFALFGVLGGLAPNFGVLLACRLLQGFGTAGLINLAVVLIGDHWEGTRRTALIGRNAAVLTLSLAILPPIGGVLTEWLGWRASFAVYSVGFGTAIACAALLPKTAPRTDVRIGEQFRAATAIVRTPPVLAAIGSGFVVFVLIFGLFLAVLPVHLDEVFGMSAAQRGLLIAVPAGSSSLMAFNAGRLRGAFGTRQLLIAASSTYAVAFTMIGATETLAVLLTAAVLYGLGEGVFIPILQDTVAESAPTESRGAVVAVFVGAVRAGQTMGPLLASVGLHAVSSGTVFLFGGAIGAALLVAQFLTPIGRPAPT